ncbi:tyrosine--tRNA ligase 1, cytoplasmic-like [Aegilops tauschii subsp. strangulata]|uniref:Tyrosyl-tRNA synthetase n=2 Tax=Triticinae TaxID=1648030 RepID=M8B1G9_AEGTA
MSIGDCVKRHELRMLLRDLHFRGKDAPVCYAWCDPSPQMHVTQGISMAININKMIQAGCQVKILMADWLARMDHHIGGKVGGDLSKVRDVCIYNIEMWRAAGMDLDRVELVWLSDQVSCHADEFWPLVMDVGRKSDTKRIKKSLRVHRTDDTRGHGSLDPYLFRDFTPAEIFHPCLQCAGIVLLHHKADIWLLDADQRVAHMLATQYCNRLQMKDGPVALFHDVPPNLLEYPEHEAWNDPRWAIFMEDDEENVGCKIKKAFCPPKITKGNPCFEYIRCIIFPWFGKFEVVRKEGNCGATFFGMDELTVAYESGILHPADVKDAPEKAINMMLRHINDRLKSNPGGKELVEAMEQRFSIPW